MAEASFPDATNFSPCCFAVRLGQNEELHRVSVRGAKFLLEKVYGFSSRCTVIMVAPGHPWKTRRARGGGLVAIQMGSRKWEIGQNMLMTAVAKMMLCLIIIKKNIIP